MARLSKFLSLLPSPSPTAVVVSWTARWEANHPPATTWVTQEGTTLSSYPGVLSLLPNGSLHYHKFSAERWRSDIHDTYIRCQSTNVYGTVISTLIHVKGGKHLHLLISFLLLKMQTSKTSDCESTLYSRSNNPTNFNAGIKQTNWQDCVYWNFAKVWLEVADIWMLKKLVLVTLTPNLLWKG